MISARGMLMALALLLLAGCVTAPKATVLDTRIDNALARGRQAIVRDDWYAADLAFAQAQKLALSVEDQSRWARASLNRAWIAHHRGEADTNLLQQVIDMPGLSESLATEARLRQVSVLLRLGEVKQAEALLAAVPQLPLTPRLLGLQARLAQTQGQTAKAMALATAQLTQARADARGQPSVEQANALRLLASLALQSQQWRDAQTQAEAAQALDGALQDSENLMDDLQLLADIHVAGGNRVDTAVIGKRIVAIQQAYCARFTLPWAPRRCQVSAATPTQ